MPVDQVPKDSPPGGGPTVGPPGPALPAPPVRPPVRPSPGTPVAALTLGVLLVVAGLVWLADETGLVQVWWPLALALAVLAVGVLLLVTARSEHAGGLVPLGIVLSVLLVLVTVAPGVPGEDGAGDRTYRPATPTELADRYDLGAGTLVLDLRDLPPVPDGEELSTEVSVGVGEIVVRIPDGPRVEVSASSGTGEVDVLGSRQEGLSPEVEDVVGDAGEGTIVLDLEVGLGTVEVTR